MKYFTTCTTLDELKKEFRRLAMLHHPDHGGDTETMKAINAEYDAVFPAFKLAYNRTAKTPPPRPPRAPAASSTPPTAGRAATTNPTAA